MDDTRRTMLGKHRGRVLEDRDPLGLGRLLVEMPGLPERSGRQWAMPCVPYASPDGAPGVLPPVGTLVWVEFEAGDPDRPVWVGCFWTADDRPMAVPTDG